MSSASLAPTGASRQPFIESLRGLAACKVLLLHYCAAFLPVLVRLPGPAHFAAEAPLSHSPLFAVLDGYSAVYLFFVMSGFVLAPSFLRAQQGTPALAAKRFVRLFLPVLAAFCVAIALRLALPQARAAAFEVSQSVWLGGMTPDSLSWQALLRDGLWNSMLAGYQGVSAFSPWPTLADMMELTPVSAAINPPMWTLHVEFWGSMMLIALARACRSLPSFLFWPFFLLLAWVAGSGHFLLFLAGFLLYRVHAFVWSRTWRTAAIGAALTAAGIYVSASKQVALLSAIWPSVEHIGVLNAGSDFHWQSQTGALMMFCGVLLCAPLRRLLDNQAMLWLGRLSFSVYLLHFPILLTVGCLIFAAVAPVSYGLAFAASLVTGGALTIGSAHYFERWIDRRAVAVSRRVGAGPAARTPPQASADATVP